MHSMHINVIHKKEIWSTRKSLKCKLPEIMLAYFGNSLFHDTKEISMLLALTYASDYLIPENAFKREIDPVDPSPVIDVKVKVECDDVHNYHPLNEDDSLKSEVYNQDIESDNNVVLGMIEIVPSQEELHNPAQYTQCQYKTQHANDVKEQSPNRCADDDSKQILSHCADNPPPSPLEDSTESMGEVEEDNPNPTSPLEDPTEFVGEGEEDNPNPTSPLEDPTESVGEDEDNNPNPTSPLEDPTESG